MGVNVHITNVRTEGNEVGVNVTSVGTERNGASINVLKFYSNISNRPKYLPVNTYQRKDCNIGIQVLFSFTFFGLSVSL